MGAKAPNLQIFLSAILIILSFLHNTSCSTNNSDELIKDMKIKAITSFELRSMTFNEMPSLFYLYDNLIKNRFDAYYKDEKNKDEKYAEFRKIHQFYALNLTFGANYKFRDIIVIQLIPAKSLDILKTNWNLTDDQVTRSGVLIKDPKGNIKFQDETFYHYFLTQYFLDHIFKPVDHPTDAEMELRIRFLLYITTDIYNRRPVTNEFIMGMIDELKASVFSDQIQMLMKFRFKYLLDAILPDRLEFVEKISRLFEKDENILKNIWRVNDNHPYYLRFFRYSGSDRRVFELKEIAGKFFKINDTEVPQNGTIIAPNVLNGKNQQLNILYWIFKMKDANFTKNILEVTKEVITNENIQKTQQKIDFLDLVDSGNFHKNEKREFYFANGYDLISNAGTGENFMNLWRRLTKHFSNSELKGFLMGKEENLNLTHLFLLPSHDNQAYVEKFLDLIPRYLSGEEIRDLMMQKTPITGSTFIIRYLGITRNVNNLEQCWLFAKDHLNNAELKDLLMNNTDSSFINKAVANHAIFNYSMGMLQDLYNQNEIREMMMKNDDTEDSTVIFRTIYADVTNVQRTNVAEYLKKLFKGHEDRLKELIAKRNLRGNTFLGEFKEDEDKEKAKPFEDLAKELFTEGELKELYVNKSV